MRLSRLGPALLLVLVACSGGGDSGTVTEAVGRSEPTSTVAVSGKAPDPGPGPSPPPVYIRGGGREIKLLAWSFCWSGAGKGVCADGHPPDSPPDIGDPSELEVAFDSPGFRFVATAEHHGVTCGRAQSMPLQATGATTWRLTPLGPPGDYDVTLFGRGTEGSADKGDLAATFRWHTPKAGPNEAPTATASIIAGGQPEVRSFGVELSVADLMATPRPGRATARVVVTSANGAALTIDLERRDLECVPEGSVSFIGPSEVGQQAARLGPPPFRYDVTLVLDSATYRGTGSWPGDVDADCSPCTRLRFTPPLPGL